MSDKLSEGRRMYELADRLFPICRSITGKGVRDSISIIEEYLGDSISLRVFDIPSGKNVFDWTVPKEWEIKEAYIEDEEGNHIIDFADNNLHVVGYSTPVDRWVDLDELSNYVFVQDDQPEAIPYVTSYYSEKYGFCMSKNQMDSMNPGRYHMYIDSGLYDGGLTIAEIVIPGKIENEIFFSTYDCHPSMANNECSGPCLWAEMIKYVSSIDNRKYTYRFVMAPETIGAISYLATDNRKSELKKKVVAGFNLSCVGDDRTFSMIKSRKEDTLADKALSYVLENDDEIKGNYMEYSYLERGSDERQYGSPLVDLPFVTFCRSKFCEYPEYHTSLDDMTVVSPEGFQGSFNTIKRVIDILEINGCYIDTYPCEPQLGKRGLYSTTSQKDTKGRGIKMIQDYLAFADGNLDLIDIACKINANPKEIIETTSLLVENGLIKEVKS